MKTSPNIVSRLFFGVLIVAITLLLYWWRKNIDPLHIKVINSIILVSISYVLSAISIDKLFCFPGKYGWLHILPTVGVIYGSVFSIFALFFVTFSNSFVLVNGLITVAFFCLDFWWRSHYSTPIAYVPYGNARDIAKLRNVKWLKLSLPILPQISIRAVVADFQSVDLEDKWRKFLVEATLKGIPVYHVRQVEESLTGRVKIRYMYENDLGSLLPSPAYSIIKQILDILFICLILPLSLPMILLTALVIKVESPRDPIIFTQKRIGQYGQEFTIYKFRSMIKESEKGGAQFAQINDSRITRVGHFLRRTRLDELPQFWNVLKGDMSLIGPRPEQKIFVEQFEKEMPFYGYRHIVKPGLSGWAQVMQGYAANSDETEVKLQYDLYYIKYFSLFLDMLIFFKTIKIIFTGYGAR